VFYVNGLEAINSGPNYYAIAGAISFDVNGNILGGVQDYNDGNGITSPQTEPGGDQIAPTSATPGSTMVVNQDTGTAILTLVTNNTSVGPSTAAGTETFALQFMSQSHALITQFDGSATSSGSMDLQTAQSSGGNFAFTLSGWDYELAPVAYGGVFSDNGTITGMVDANDAGTPYLAPSPGNMTGPDNGTTGAYGRGTATVTITNSLGTTTLALVYYVVGPEVIRIIDMDAGGSGGAGVYAGSAAVGSAYGQGTGTFDSRSLTTVAASSVFGVQGALVPYAAVGMITPTPGGAGVAAGTFTGEGDVDEEGSLPATLPSTISGNYTIGSNGYGGLAITNAGLEDVSTLGLYLTDPALNLSDPNNTTGGGGALVLDLVLPSGAGIVVPQTDMSATDFTSSYGFGAKVFNPSGEFDYVGQAPISSLALTSATGDISDPFAYFVSGSPNEYSGVPFAGTAVADTNEATTGRYTISPLAVGPVGTGGPTDNYNYVIYQASGGLLFWMDEDTESLSLGTLQAQSASSLKALHAKRGPLPKSQAKRKR
jgi:hypothetical protein